MATTGGASPLSLSSQSSIYSTVSTLMQAVDAPITAQQTKLTNLQNLNTVYDTVESDLSALDSAATAMTDAVTQPLSARMVSSSDSEHRHRHRHRFRRARHALDRRLATGQAGHPRLQPVLERRHGYRGRRRRGRPSRSRSP